MAGLVYTAAELARELGVSEKHLYRMAKTPGGPPTLPMGRRILFPKKAVERWLDEQSSKAGRW